MDSRKNEQTPVKEKPGAKTIEMRRGFSFFDNPISFEESEIVETADITYKSQLVGALIGRIFSGSEERISAFGAHIAFTIDKKEDETNTVAGPRTEFDPFGARFETPVIYIMLKNGKKYASLGSQEEPDRISFVDWVETVNEHKDSIKALVAKREAQPSPFRLHELLEAEYKIT